jgi:ribosome-binding protein aMBF1 (putative translation factor)
MARNKGPAIEARDRLRRRYVHGRPHMERLVEEARESANLAQKVYALRTRAGLSQRELAERVGTTASVISRLEDADHDRHSLTMLRRIAAALGARIEVNLIAKKLSPRKGTRQRSVKRPAKVTR